MGPNGAGKSTLAGALLGHPAYTVTAGTILLDGEDVTRWATDVRAKAGLFLAFQYPEAIEGVSVTQFLRQAMAARKGDRGLGARGARAHDRVDGAPRHGHRPSPAATSTRASPAARRSATRSCRWRCSSRWSPCSTRPTRASTSTRCVSSAAACGRCARRAPSSACSPSPTTQRLLEELVPDVVHILVDGRVVASGGPELAARVEAEGYEAWR